MPSSTKPSKAEETLAKEQAEAGITNEMPAIYYDTEKRDYLQQNASGRWIGYNQAQIKRRLRQLGYSQKAEGAYLSPVEEILSHSEDHNDVRYAAPLAGRTAGFYAENGFRYLVTDSPKFIEPSPGEWPTLKTVLEGLFLNQDSEQGERQLQALYGWLQAGVKSLRAGKITQAQALAICGPVNCGKSLLQNLITQILGGRSAKAARYMMGKTDFNAELFEAEHLMLEDEHMSRATRNRVALAAQIKNITVSADTVSCHRKGRTAINLGAWWRISITLNDNPESLTVLPPLNSDFADKIILLKASHTKMPMPTHTGELKAAFWDQLLSELPAFIHFLLNEFEIPPEQVNQRYGVGTWHHPDIAESLHTISPEASLLKMIDRGLWSDPNKTEWKGSADDLRTALMNHEDTKRDAIKLLDYGSSTGTYLGRLASSDQTRNRIKEARTNKARLWKITKEIAIK